MAHFINDALDEVTNQGGESKLALHYYESGQRVDLEPMEYHVGFQDSVARPGGVSQSLWDSLNRGHAVAGGWHFISSEDVIDARQMLSNAGLIVPVFWSEHRKAHLIILPSVYIEGVGSDMCQEVLDELRGMGVPEFNVERDGVRLILRPKSNSGEDAARIAAIAMELPDQLRPRSAVPDVIGCISLQHQRHSQRPRSQRVQHP